MWYFANEITRFRSFRKFPVNILLPEFIQLKEWYLLLQTRIRKPTCIRNIYVHECILSLSSALFIALFKHTSVFHIQPRLFILESVKRTHQKKLLWFSIFHLAFGRHIVRWICFLDCIKCCCMCNCDFELNEGGCCAGYYIPSVVADICWSRS